MPADVTIPQRNRRWGTRRRSLWAAVLFQAALALALPIGAGAQVCEQPCPPPPSVPSGQVVVVDISDVVASGPADTDVLRRIESETPAPLFATYVGLSAVGTTLAVLTAHRRGARRKEIELRTGIAFARRHRRQDFWTGPVPSTTPSP